MNRNEIPFIFKRPVFAVPDDAPLQGVIQLNRSVRFHEIASRVPGWSDVLAAHDVALSIADARPPQPSPVGDLDAARAILDGEDPADTVARVAGIAEIESRREIFGRVQEAAVREVSDRATAWIGANLTSIEDALTEQVAAVFDGATKAVNNLEGVHAATDLADRPLAAPHWAELIQLAHELSEIDRFAAILRPDRTEPFPNAGVPHHWPLVGVLDDYPAVWGRYFMTDRLIVETHREVLATLPPETAPWDDPDATVRLRNLAELRPVARVRLGENYRAYLNGLAQRAERDRQTLLKNDIQRLTHGRYGTAGSHVAPWVPVAIPRY